MTRVKEQRRTEDGEQMSRGHNPLDVGNGQDWEEQEDGALFVSDDCSEMERGMDRSSLGIGVVRSAPRLRQHVGFPAASCEWDGFRRFVLQAGTSIPFASWGIRSREIRGGDARLTDRLPISALRRAWLCCGCDCDISRDASSPSPFEGLSSFHCRLYRCSQLMVLVFIAWLLTEVAVHDLLINIAVEHGMLVRLPQHRVSRQHVR